MEGVSTKPTYGKPRDQGVPHGPHVLHSSSFRLNGLAGKALASASMTERVNEASLSRLAHACKGSRGRSTKFGCCSVSRRAIQSRPRPDVEVHHSFSFSARPARPDSARNSEVAGSPRPLRAESSRIEWRGHWAFHTTGNQWKPGKEGLSFFESTKNGSSSQPSSGNHIPCRSHGQHESRLHPLSGQQHPRPGIPHCAAQHQCPFCASCTRLCHDGTSGTRMTPTSTPRHP